LNINLLLYGTVIPGSNPGWSANSILNIVVTDSAQANESWLERQFYLNIIVTDSARAFAEGASPKDFTNPGWSIKHCK